MENLFGLVEAFYSRFILRDLLAKVTPGFMFLGASYLIISDIYTIDIPISFGTGILLFAISWIVGFAIQGVGEFTKLIKYHVDEDARNRYSQYMNQLNIDKISNDKDLERLVVIKETCGNSYVSLLLILILYFLNFIINKGIDTDTIVKLIPILVFYIIIILALFYMHRVHIVRQDEIVNSRLKK